MNAEIESLTRVSPMKVLYKKHEHMTSILHINIYMRQKEKGRVFFHEFVKHL